MPWEAPVPCPVRRERDEVERDADDRAVVGRYMSRMRRAATSLHARGVGGRDGVGVEERERVGVRGMLASAGAGAALPGVLETGGAVLRFLSHSESARAGSVFGGMRGGDRSNPSGILGMEEGEAGAGSYSPGISIASGSSVVTNASAAKAAVYSMLIPSARRRASWCPSSSPSTVPWTTSKPGSVIVASARFVRTNSREWETRVGEGSASHCAVNKRGETVGRSEGMQITKESPRAR